MTSSLKVRIKPVRRVADTRGHLFEPLAPAELAGWRNVHVVVTLPGQVRGNHVHRLTREVLIVDGPALVRWREADGIRDLRVPADETLQLDIPPGVAHAIQHTGDTPGVAVSFTDREHDPAKPDTERDVLIEPGSANVPPPAAQCDTSGRAATQG